MSAFFISGKILNACVSYGKVAAFRAERQKDRKQLHRSVQPFHTFLVASPLRCNIAA
nr:MAG TPA: hypothetical protein [Caudoviricetes sp.]